MSRIPEELGAFARRAVRRETALLLEAELLAHTTVGLALATAVLLGTLVLLDGDLARIAGLALAAAAVSACSAVAVHRALARRPGPLAAALAVDPTGELAAALELEGLALEGLALETRAGPGTGERFARLALEGARERAATIDLARALPRRTPRESAAAPLLAVAAGALASILATRPAPVEGLALGPGAREATHRAAETRAVHEAAKLLALRARELATAADGREAALELARAARELDAGSTPLAAIARLARARGKLEAARSPGLGDALDRARAEVPSLDDLARKLRDDRLDEEAKTKARDGAARAAKALEGTPGAEDARSKLDKLASELDRSGADKGAKESQAQAAEKASDALAQAGARARKDEAREQASRALDDARSSLAEGGKPRSEPPSSPASSPSPGKKGGAEKRPGGGDAREGEKRSTPNKEAGGDGPKVAGKGGKDDTEAPSATEGPEPGSHAASLRGRIGERGASAVLAAESYAQGATGERARAVFKDYRRSEEEALDKEPLPLDRRTLVKRYFERLEESR